MLLNLIINAVQAIADSRHEGVIRIRTALNGDFIEIRVSDTGTGIPTEYREKVFEPFFTTKVVGRGLGQGLATAYWIVVQRHNGRIWFDTEVGKGTTFVVQLPVSGTVDESSEIKRQVVNV